MKVGNDGLRGLEREVAVKLETIGCARDVTGAQALSDQEPDAGTGPQLKALFFFGFDDDSQLLAKAQEFIDPICGGLALGCLFGHFFEDATAHLEVDVLRRPDIGLERELACKIDAGGEDAQWLELIGLGQPALGRTVEHLGELVAESFAV